jgi:hypothetical protein
MRRLQLLAAHLIAIAATALCMAAPAAAQSRLALLIANSAYQGAPALTTPETDKALIAQTLEAAGYDVTQYGDLTTQTIGGAFGAFIEKIKAAGPDAVVFVYFSGYAAQQNGDDYLVPVDAQITTADAVPNVTLPLSAVMKALTDVPSAARIIVLDAARDGGFGKAGGAPVADGLALTGVPPGVLLAYSAAPGVYQPEVGGTNSPYANALATVMRQPGLDIEQIFKGVRLQVNEATKGTQTPWMTSALNVEVKLFAAPAAGTTAAAAPPQMLAPALGVSNVAVPSKKRRRVTKAAMRRMPADEAYRVAVEQDDLRDYQWFVEAHPTYPLAQQIWDTIFGRREEILWRRALASGTPRAYWNYLARYPNGSHSYAARDWLNGRGEPLPAGYVPVPEPLPSGYYDEALGLPDLVPDGFDSPAPVFFGGLGPEFVPAPSRFDQAPIQVIINPPPPTPTPLVHNLPLVTPCDMPGCNGGGLPPLPDENKAKTSGKQIINSADLDPTVQKKLADDARAAKEKADQIAKAEAAKQAALGPTPPLTLPSPTTRQSVLNPAGAGTHSADAAACLNKSTADMKGMTDQQLKNCAGALIRDFKRNQANGGNPAVPVVSQPNSQTVLPTPIKPGPQPGKQAVLPTPAQPAMDAAACRNMSKADMKGMTDQQLKNCAGALIRDFKRNQAGKTASPNQNATANASNPSLSQVSTPNGSGRAVVYDPPTD